MFPLTSVINMLKKKATLCVWSIYFAYMYAFSGALTGQWYVDENLHPHVVLIYQTAGNNFLFQQVNAPPPICNTARYCVQAGHVNTGGWPSGSSDLHNQTHLGYSRPGYVTCIPSTLLNVYVDLPVFTRISGTS